MNLQLLSKNLRAFILFLLPLLVSNNISAQQIVNTYAGTGTGSYSGDGGAAISATIDNDVTIGSDTLGNIYIADYLNNRIRKIHISTGIITTVAGNGTAGYSGDGGSAISAELNGPSGVWSDQAGNIYIADRNNNCVRLVNTSGVIKTIAGSSSAGSSGDGGAATAATLNNPGRVFVDASGNVYISDRNNYKVRKVNTSGIISTFIGTGTAGYSGDGGAATAAEINTPFMVKADASGNIYLADLSNYRIRMVNSSGTITTIAGNGSAGYSGDGGAATAAAINGPYGFTFDATGNMYIGDNSDSRIRKIDLSGIITTFAGVGYAGYGGDGGPASAAVFYEPSDFVIIGNDLIIADQLNNRVRAIDFRNSIPYFVGGISQTISVCENSSANSINTVLTVIDSNVAQRETWSTILSPSDGSLGGFTRTAISNDTAVVPSGLTYTPTSGFTGTDSFKVMVSDGIASDTITIYVNISPLPNPGTITITGTTTVCSGTTTTLSESVSGGTWSSGSTGIATVSSSGVVTGVSVGTAIISYAVTNSCGTSYATQSIAVTLTPSVAAISGVSSLCATATGTLSDATTGGTWSASNSNAYMTGTTLTAVTAGLDTIYYTVTNSCGTAVASHVVTINVMPVAITGTTSVCVGSMITLSETTSGGSWSSSATGTATVDASGDVYGVSAGTVNISYMMTGGTGCGVWQGVTVNPLPSVIGGPASVCQGSTITLSNTTAGGTWTSSNTGIATITSGSATTGILTGVSNGSATITYMLGTGCQVTTNITVNALPDAIGGPTSVCVGSTIGLSDGSGTGTWASSNSSLATVNSSGVVGGVAAGSPTITFTLTGGCYVTLPITVNALPGSISGTPNVCTGLTSSLTDGGGTGTWASSNTSLATVDASGVVYGIAAGTLTITYTLATTCLTTTSFTVNQSPTAIGGATSVCAGGATATVTDGEPFGTWASSNTAIVSVSSSGTITGGTAGTANISYTISGCPAITSITVNALPGAIITPLGDTMLCPGDELALTSNTGTGYTYQWFSGGATITGETDDYYIATTGANYSVQVTNGSGCQSVSVLMDVSINPATATLTTTSLTTFCSSSSAILNASPSTGMTYQWLLDGGGISGATGANYSADISGSYNVVVSNLAGCSATSSALTLTVIPGPADNLTLSGSLTFCTGDSVIISGDAGSGLTYQWMVGGVNIMGATNMHYTARTTGSYQLMETNSHPCSTTSAVASVVEMPLPNAAISASGATTFCSGGSVLLAGPTGDIGYQWYNGGFAIPGASLIHYTAAASGYYAVKVTSPAGCMNTTYPPTVVDDVITPVITPMTSTKFCWGGSSLLGVNVSATTGVTYQWQDGGVNINRIRQFQHNFFHNTNLQ